MTSNYKIPTLPLKLEVESKVILKQLTKSSRKLAELKGIGKTIPNENILISTLILQEAKDSSEIENIVTTHDELFRAQVDDKNKINISTKEVQDYASALRKGFELIRKKRILTVNDIINIQSELEKNNAGIRKQLGTALKNDKTGEIIYTPPQNEADILKYMKNLEDFINNDDLSDIDSLIKMAIIHHQFESIHPFYDGNGRTGRIINMLYLVTKDLLELPILYLSRYIIQNKSDYYRLLQEVRDNNNWEDWILYILEGVEKTAIDAIETIIQIKLLMADYKKRIREEFPLMYSQDLINIIFKHPYTKIGFLESELRITRKTAASYLNKLSDSGFLVKNKIGTNNFYFNKPLFDIFTQ